MAHLDRLSEPLRSYVANLSCPAFPHKPWAPGPPLAARKVVLVSTAGIHRHDDQNFRESEGDYRVIPSTSGPQDLVMSHVSSNFDRLGFQQDWNVVFPLDRLREMVTEGLIGSLSENHYSFMGATDPTAMEPAARKLAGKLAQAGVDAALLVPV